MKRIAIFAFMAMIMTAFAPEAQAQGLLKGLADKAKEKVKEKIVKTVVPGTDKTAETTVAKPAQQNGQVASRVTNSDGGSTDELIDDLMIVDEFSNPRKGFEDISIRIAEPQEGITFNSIAEAIKALPQLPTATQVVNRDEAWVASINEFDARCQNFSIGLAERFNNSVRNMTQGASVPKATEDQKKMAQASAMKILELMQKYGINPEKTSDKEMEAFVKKMYASGELKMPGGVGNIEAFMGDEPESKDDDFDAIREKIQALQEAYFELIAETTMMNAFDVNKPLEALHNEIIASWKGSEANKKVLAMELDLGKRFGEFVKDNPSWGKEGEENYPPFWTEERIKENKVIEEYNKANAEKWLKVIRDAMSEKMSVVKEIKAIDDEIEASFSNKSDVTYCDLKNQLAGVYRTWAVVFYMTMEKAYGMPCVEYLYTEGATNQQ